jgi:hypothetical protein
MPMPLVRTVNSKCVVKLQNTWLMEPLDPEREMTDNET